VANTDSDLHHAMVGPTTTGCRSTAANARPSRGCAAISSRGVKEAVAEIERTAEMDGFVAYLLSSYPHGNTTLSDADDPCGGHRADRQTHHHPRQHQRRHAVRTVGGQLPGTAHFYDAPGRMLELIFGGVLDRFPG